MHCERCENTSDWIGDESEWTRLHDDVAAIRPLYECDVCGHRQRTG